MCDLKKNESTSHIQSWYHRCCNSWSFFPHLASARRRIGASDFRLASRTDRPSESFYSSLTYEKQQANSPFHALSSRKKRIGSMRTHDITFSSQPWKCLELFSVHLHCSWTLVPPSFFQLGSSLWQWGCRKWTSGLNDIHSMAARSLDMFHRHSFHVWHIWLHLA